QDGRPIEGYRFVGPMGEFLFTSHPRAVNIAGYLFQPLQITRTTIEASSVIDSIQTMDFNIPADCDLATLYCYEDAPTDLQAWVYRGHAGDDLETEYTIEWQGEWAGSSVTGMWATIRTGSVIQTRLQSNVSSVLYQRICNHVLFDERC